MSAAWPLVRVPLDDLIREHHRGITAMRQNLEVKEDVWLLRYLLSFRDDIPAACQAAKAALTWRQENASIVEAARARHAPKELAQEELDAINECFVAAYHGCTRFGDPVFISRVSASNVNRLMEVVSEAKLELWFDFVNECAWQYCEAETRVRNYFVMQINIQDVQAAKMMQQNRAFLRVLGNSSKVNDWLRPQLFGKTYIVNPPRWLSMASRLAGGIMSKKSLEKVAIHKAKVNEGQELCPFARDLFEEMPTFLGGSANADDLLPAGPRASDAALPILARLPLPQVLPALPCEESRTFASAVEESARSQGSKGSQLAMSMCSAVTALEFPLQERPSFCRRVCCFLQRRREDTLL